MRRYDLLAVVKRAALCDEKETQEETVERAAITDAASAPRREHANEYDAAAALLSLRNSNRIGDETLTRMLREVDLGARAAEGDAMPTPSYAYGLMAKPR